MTAVQTPRQFALNRFPKTDRELYHFVRGIWGWTVPSVQVCPNHTTPFRAFADAYFARHPIVIWKASRGFGGKTNTLGLLGNTEAVALHAQVSILGGSGAQSMRVYEAGQEAWSSPHAPKSILQQTNRFHTSFTTGAWIETLMASQRSVRGTHPQRLRLDEIDEMDLPILEASLGTTMEGRRGMQKGVQPQIVMSSTHQYPDKTMSTMLARAKENGWPIYEWCYRECMNPVDGWLTRKEVDTKRSVVPKAMWDAEYDLQEPSFEGRAIDTAAVDYAFSEALGVTDQDLWSFDWMQRNTDGTRPSELHESLLAGLEGALEAPPIAADGGNLARAVKHGVSTVSHHGQPVSHLLHVTGVDWAKERDLTVVATFDTSDGPDEPWRCVAWQCFNRIPWPAQVARVEQRMRRYGGYLAHDATGIGNVLSDYLDPEMQRRSKGRIHDIVLSSTVRATIFTDYISAIEDGMIVYPRIKRAYDEHKYVTMDDLFGRGHPPDSVVAGAVAWSLRDLLRKPGIVLPTSIPQENRWNLGSGRV